MNTVSTLCVLFDVVNLCGVCSAACTEFHVCCCAVYIVVQCTLSDSVLLHYVYCHILGVQWCAAAL